MHEEHDAEDEEHGLDDDDRGAWPCGGWLVRLARNRNAAFMIVLSAI